jgi:hemoglobin
VSDDSVAPRQVTVHEYVGGQPFFDRLVDRFYAGVADDPVLRPLYPDDLGPSKRHLAGFLAQYWGGPPEYSAERGHPRLRMRHFPFAIGPRERDAWLSQMLAALDACAREIDMAAEIETAMRDYFTHSAGFLVNQPG